MRSVFRRFHDFRKHALHILGMDEKDRRAVRTNACGAKNTLAYCFEFLPRRSDIWHFEADVMLAAQGILLEEVIYRGTVIKGLDQLDLRPIHARIGRRIDEADLHALLWQVEGFLDICRTHRVTIMRDRLCDRGRCYADVIETSQFHYSTTTSVLTELAMKQALCNL